MIRGLLVVLFFGLFLTGCRVSSQTAMYGKGGRMSYNAAAQNTTNQELLLNLVRLRYSDTPYFLDLNNITTQFSFTSKLFPGITMPGFSRQSPATLGGELIWQNQPTIQYSPLKGKNFAIQLMHPLSLRLIQSLVLTGWEIDRVFHLLVQSMADIPNAASASGPVPQDPPHYKKFQEASHLLRHFQKDRQLQVGVRYSSSKKSHLTSGGDVDMGFPDGIQLTFPSKSAKAKHLAQILEGVEWANGKYILDMSQAFNEEAEIGIMTRSLLGCMYYLSLGVQIPPRDLIAGTVGITRYPNGDFFNWKDVIGDLICIYSTPYYPQYAYLAVQYRGYWFYIDDADINSKKTFVLLQQVYNLQAKQHEKEPPLLTIPLGIPSG